MKNLLKYIIMGVLIFAAPVNAFASCYTGFACSIDDLEKQQANKYDEYTAALHKYFDKDINEDIFFKKNYNDLTYNELFIFNTIF
ncbi:MAG: hypothetical protein LUG16_01870 [Candidatus Gastranaerophilales bacterium]|nr:hypothetical protein [Candidatus Gastranaerophilales bacterium]